MQVPEFWRGPDNRLYRIRRDCRQVADPPGQRYSISAFRVGARQPAAEASVVLPESEVLEMARTRHQVPTPEQLYAEAFRTLMGNLGRLASPDGGAR